MKRVNLPETLPLNPITTGVTTNPGMLDAGERVGGVVATSLTDAQGESDQASAGVSPSVMPNLRDLV